MRSDESLARSNRIDTICDGFEMRMLAGESPRIEDVLARHSEVDQSRLLRELLLIEVEVRCQRGEAVTTADYSSRFPDQTEVIDDALSTILSGSAAMAETVDVSLSPADETYVPSDMEVEATLVPGSATHPESAVTTDTGGKRFGDYELLNEIARGGMGVVYKARQAKLNRIVALKMIRSGELAGQDEVQRFHTEAEAAAQLDHPNIVPIYEVGEQNGLHFFSMGYVEGKGLDARLKDGPLPPRDAAELIKTIAEAIQYAHDKGIVHRDLKPANVLIETDGKPRITDFGLAKNIAGDSGMTATGQVMGTPSYMPPEQAAGKTEEIGPLADVYSLGAMLYALVTGRPPFQAASVMETLKQVLEQEPVSPRVLNAAVDKDLETICLKTLEKEPAKRYATASEFAADIARYLDGEPIIARPIGRPARLWRWCKRNPLGATVVGLLVFLAIAGPAIAAYQIEINRQLDEALSGETEQREKAEANEKVARESERKMGIALDGEKAALARKDKALQETEAAIDRYVETVKNAELLKDPRFKDLLKLLLKDALVHYQRFVEEHKDEQDEKTQGRMAGALLEIGNISATKGDTQAAITAFGQARIIRQRLLDENPKVTEHRKELATIYNNIGVLYHETGKLPEAIAAHQEALKLRDLLVRNNRTTATIQEDLAQSLNNLGHLYDDIGKIADAISAHQRALTIREELARSNPSVRTYQQFLADSHNSLGLAYRATGKPAEALLAYQQARKIQERLVREKPTVTKYQNVLAITISNLGNLYKATGKFDEALLAYRQASTIRERLARENPTVTKYQNSLAASHINLGALYQETGKHDEAMAAYQQALKISERLVGENPTVTGYESHLAAAHDGLGLLYYKIGKTTEALAAFQQALKICDRLARENPTNTRYQSGLAAIHGRLGTLYSDTGKTDEAMAAYQQGLKISERLARENPTVTDYQNSLAVAHDSLGVLYYKIGKSTEAIVALQQALKIQERLARENPTVTEYKIDLAVHYHNLGMMFHGLKQTATALESFGRELRVLQAIVAEHPAHRPYRTELAKLHRQIGGLYRTASRPQQALEQYRKAAKVEPTEPRNHISLGIALQQLNRYDESMTALNQAIKLDPKSEWAIRNRGINYQRQGMLKEALRDLDRAAALAPEEWPPHYTRGKILREMKRYDEAVACFDRALTLNPKYAWGYYYRGLTHSRRGRFPLARKDFESALRWEPKSARFANGLAWLLATSPDATVRNGTKAVECATKACELTQWKNGGYLDTLAAAYAEAGKFQKAIEWQEKAIALLSKSDKPALLAKLALFKSGKPYHERWPIQLPVEARKPIMRK